MTITNLFNYMTDISKRLNSYNLGRYKTSVNEDLCMSVVYKDKTFVIGRAAFENYYNTYINSGESRANNIYKIVKHLDNTVIKNWIDNL